MLKKKKLKKTKKVKKLKKLKNIKVKQSTKLVETLPHRIEGVSIRSAHLGLLLVILGFRAVKA